MAHARHNSNDQGGDFLFSEELRTLLRDTAKQLRGSERRMFMAKTARLFGPQGQRRAARELGWDRKTLRKGEYELEHGPIHDHFEARGRKPVEAHLPNLRRDIQEIAAPDTQTDPTFRTTRRYRRVTGNNVRNQLRETYSYTDEALPTVQTIRAKLNALDYRPRKVVKSKPKKSCRRPMRFSDNSIA